MKMWIIAVEHMRENKNEWELVCFSMWCRPTTTH